MTLIQCAGSPREEHDGRISQVRDELWSTAKWSRKQVGIGFETQLKPSIAPSTICIEGMALPSFEIDLRGIKQCARS